MKTSFKKLFLATTIFVIFFSILTPLIVPNFAYADSICSDSTIKEKTPSVWEAAGCNGSDNLVANIITNILYVIIFVVGIVSAIYIVVGGIKYMSSKGDASATQTAKKTTIYSLIGLAVTSLAFIIVNFSINLIYSNGSVSGGENGESNGQESDSESLGDSEALQLSMIPEKRIILGSSEAPRVHIMSMQADTADLSWKSSDPSIVSVNDKGRIFAIKEGTAIITARIKDNETTTGIENNGIVFAAKKGTAVIAADNNDDDEVAVESENNGIVLVVKEGTTTITTETEDDKTDLTEINEKDFTIITETEDDKTDLTESNEKEPTITTETEDDEIDSIESDEKEPTTEIKNDEIASIEITVVKLINPKEVILKPSSFALAKGTSFKVRASIFPSNASNKHITWSSKDKSIASVNSSGEVTGKKEGITTIVAKTDNGKTATVDVKVTNTKVEDGPARINNGLLNNLITYYQTNHINDSVNVKGKPNCGKNYGRASCGASSYLASYYTLTREKVKYSSFVENICKSGLGIPLNVPALAPGGAQQQYFVKKYHARLYDIARTWSASVNELKQGHPIIYLVNHNEFSPYGAHYVAGLSYDKEKKKIFIWNPNQGTKDCKKSNCWYSKKQFEAYVTKANNIPTQTSGVWTMKRTSYWK